MDNLAPIVLFVYNRPYHTQQTIEALKANNLANESELYIFSDASKDGTANKEVELVRNYIKTITGFKKINIIERTQNYGLAKSIIEGVTEIVNRYGKIIVLEDDLVTHPQFLYFMNKSLDLYKDSKKVFSITGYSHFRLSENKIINKTYFIKLTSTWTWATWSDRWSAFEENIGDSKALDYDTKLRSDFNYDNSYDFYKMLKNRNNGKVKSWGILWYWNVFKIHGLTLYPTETLVDHIGLDGTGQNGRNYIVVNKRIKKIDYDFLFTQEYDENATDRRKLVKVLRNRKINAVLDIFKIKNIVNLLGFKI